MNRQSVLLVAVLLLCVVLFTVPVQAATTEIHIVKYANDGTTILSETTKTYQWMEANLPIFGDGVTHYYHQGPVFIDDPDPEVEALLRWNPEENTNVIEKDEGAVKGSNLKDLCDLVGGMSPGEEVRVKATDGMSKRFNYANVYQYTPRQGPIVVTWYRDGFYTGPQYIDGMKLVFFADTSVNEWGYHAFGNYDWYVSADPKYWYYYVQGSEYYPTTTGLSVKVINEIAIFSDDPVPLTADFSADMDKVVNSGFETGTFSGWTQTGASIVNTISHSGTYSAKLSSSKASVSQVQQTVDLTNVDQLSYYYRIDQVTTGWLDIYIDSTKVATYNTVTSWTKGTIDVSSYTGTHVIKVVAGSGTSKTNKITAYLDDVTAMTSYPNGVIGYPPLTVNFRDTSGGEPATWSWTFGDGGTSTLQNPVHLYQTAGTYTVSLTVTNAGESDSMTKTGFVTVNGYPPVANFVGAPTGGNSPLTVQFTDQSTNSPTAWLWNFGDGQTSTLKNPVHQYQSAGTFTVTLTATNAYGSDGETKTNYITVTQAGQTPVANFVGSPLSGKAPLTVQFTDHSTNNPTSWSWNFGDRTTSSLQNPSHAYTKRGSYTVTLTVSNTNGSNTMTRSKYIVVS